MTTHLVDTLPPLLFSLCPLIVHHVFLSCRLHQKHEGQLSVMQLMDMLTGVASGMKYLTEMGFIHKRLAAHKVKGTGGRW